MINIYKKGVMEHIVNYIKITFKKKERVIQNMHNLRHKLQTLEPNYCNSNCKVMYNLNIGSSMFNKYKDMRFKSFP